MLQKIEALTGEPINRIHIVGGGTKSLVLNQYAATSRRSTPCAFI